MRDILRLAQPTLARFLPGLLLGILASGSAVALLATASWLITRASEQPPILYLGFAIVGVRAFALGKAFFRYVERLASHDAAFRGLATLRVGIYRRLIPLSPDGLTGTRRGDLLTRLVGDVDRLQDLPLRVVQPLATALVVSVLSVIGVTIVLPVAGVILAGALVVAGIVGALVQRVVAASADRSLAPLSSSLADTLVEHLDRLDVLAAFGRLDESERSIEAADARLRYARLRQSRGRGLVVALNSLIAGFATLLIVVVADLPVTMLAVVVLVPIAVFEVFGMVPLALGAWRAVAVSASRVAAVVPEQIPAEIPVAPASPRAIGRPEIVLAGVSARWPGGGDGVSNVTLAVRPGECVLVTGPSGAGKTSLAHLLVRFLAYSGSYTIGGIEASELDPDDVRRVIGLCEQSPHIFDDTLRQNLAFANEQATDATLLAALESVGLRDWAVARGGLDARVGERGSLVSGGQAQRIALARALLADFPVLVLDEPTANVDADTAEHLLSDLVRAAVASDRAVIVISHAPVDPALVTRAVALASPPLAAQGVEPFAPEVQPAG
jgi:ATP-binding cassette subfamily C protein CydC